MIKIYADGAYEPVRRQGGWAAIIIEDGEKRLSSDSVPDATSNRMEITAALEGIRHTPEGAEVVVYTDSQYVYGCAARGWQRRANRDLWGQLDEAVRQRKVTWEWLDQAESSPLHKEAHRLATEMSQKQVAAPAAAPEPLTHLDESGRPRMVDISKKAETQREAVAKGVVCMKAETLERIKEGAMPKGNVLAVAQLAGIMAAKQTPFLIPLCHPILIEDTKVEFSVDEGNSCIEITATVKSYSKTGVEMEALTATAVAALTIYDMCKAIDRGMKIENIRLTQKSGGKSGTIKLE